MMRRTFSLLTAASTTPLKPYEHYRDTLNKGYARCADLILSKGEGSYVIDVHNHKYLDFTCGIGVTNLGHCHPRLVKVVQNQAANIWHSQVALGIHEQMCQLVDNLHEVLPETLRNLFITNTGTEAVEASIRMSRCKTRRHRIIAMQGAYHGRTQGSLALTTSKQSYGTFCGPHMPGVIIVPPPYSSQLKVPPHTDPNVMIERCVSHLEDAVYQQTHPQDVAMLIVEPTLGEGGYLPLPVSYLHALRKFCDKHEILLCFDEVQCGFGRSGTLFQFTQTGVTPDILLFAKGIANGLPLAGLATTHAIGSASPPGTQGGTYAGNCLSCASANEVLKIFKEERILENCAARSRQLFDGLKDMQRRHPTLPVQEIRGRGLLVALQFDATAPKGISGEWVKQALQRRMLLMNTSMYETMRFMPPLTIAKNEVAEGLRVMEESLLAALDTLKWNPSAGAKPIKGFKPCCPVPCYNAAGVKDLDGPCRWIAEH